MTQTKSQEIDGVGVEQIERIFWLLRDKLPRVLEANRYFEEQTGFHNEAGTNNIVDAFSHLATLVEHADQLDEVGQSEQVAHLEDHLRRSMMESFEQVVKLRLGVIAELWETFQRDARHLQLRDALPGTADAVELEELRQQMKQLLDKGRATKREVTWEAWEDGTDYLTQASEVSEVLRQNLEDGIAAARARSHQRRFLVLAICVIVLALGIGLGIGAWVIS